MAEQTLVSQPTPGQPYNALIASAQLIKASRKLQLQRDKWQEEAWAYYESLGEFTYAVNWLAAALSRVRLVAARRVPGAEGEPEPVTEGPAAEALERLAGGPGGQAALLKSLGVKLSVVGDAYFTGEEPDRNDTAYLGEETVWGVKSPDEIRVDGSSWSVRTGESRWEKLKSNHLVGRIWIADERYSWRATSGAKSALGTMRKIDLYDRHIIATLVSRLAFNGLLLIPDNVTFPVKEQYKDADDPFVAELIEVASASIKNPGSASAAIPLPLKVPPESIEKFTHLVLSTDIGEKVVEARDRELLRLATMVNTPREVLTGMGDVNHWGAWQIDESAFKIHIAPLAEVIAHGLTVTYLHPALKAAGENVIDEDGGRWVIWYDGGELTAKPDLSKQATDAYDKFEISPKAFRRETGFEESDVPTKIELREMALKVMLKSPRFAPQAFEMLTGEQLLPAATTPVTGAPAPSSDADAPDRASPGSDEAPVTGPPETKDDVPEADMRTVDVSELLNSIHASP